MNLVNEVNQSWGWTGISAAEVVSANPFGNLIIRDSENRYWRLCPEDVYCEIIAECKGDLDALFHNQEFQIDWRMQRLADEAERKLGKLPEGQKYCLKLPGVLGGEYVSDNLGAISHVELIRFSGDLGRQIKDLPEGTDIELDIE